MIGKPETKSAPLVPVKPETQKPLARLIKPSEIASGQAALGNRETHPTGRLALTPSNPQILLGQTIKGRYQIVEFVGHATASYSYLAGDKLNAGKRVAVLILSNSAEATGATGKIFGEERVSLSHVNHPNIAKVIDSGELPEGNPFIISEAVKGESLKSLLEKGSQMNASRVARIVRQAADALGEVHRNGVLHRRLTPADIILTINEKGAEQVKLINFGVSAATNDGGDFVYQSPEQLQGKTATFASDLYSLAVIAYQMLTARLPFNTNNRREMLKLQREGIRLSPSNLRLDAPPIADRILEKALAFESSDRYPKTGDFGMAFFNALTTVAPWKKEQVEEAAEKVTIPAKIEIPNIAPAESKSPAAPPVNTAAPPVVPPIKAEKSEEEFILPKIDDFEIEYIDDETAPETFAVGESTDDIHIESATMDESVNREDEVKSSGDLAWERRSTGAAELKSGSWTGMLIAGLSVLLLCAGLWGIWYYFLHRPVKPEYIAPAPTEVQTAQIESQSPIIQRPKKVKKKLRKSKHRRCRVRLSRRRNQLILKTIEKIWTEKRFAIFAAFRSITRMIGSAIRPTINL